jgi:hypothetical protein
MNAFLSSSHGDEPEWSLKLVSPVKTQWAVSFGSGDTNLLWTTPFSIGQSLSSVNRSS